MIDQGKDKFELERPSAGTPDDETHYRKLVENSRNLISQHLPDGTICFSSPSVTRLLGYLPEEVNQTSVFELIHPDDRSSFIKSFENSFYQPTLIPRHRLKTKSGSFRWFETQLFPLKSDDNNLLQASYRDITERITLEEKQKQINKSFQTIFNNINVGHAIINPEGHFIEVNRMWADSLGYAVEELTGMKESDLTYPDDHKVNDKYMKKLFSGQPVRFTKRLMTRSGQIVWGNMSFAPVFGQDNRIESIVGCMVDITQQKQIEQSILESERNYRMIADSVTDIISRHDLDGRINYISPSVYNILGYKPEEMTGVNPFDIIHPEDRQEVQRTLNYLLKPEPHSRVIFIFRIVNKAGSYVWVENTARITDDRSSVLCVSRDITQRRLHEEKLEKNEKTLIQQNKELLKINEELDRFAYRTSHDLRAPLTSILGLIEIIHNADNSQQKDEYLELIKKSALKLDSFVQEILKFSRNSRLKVEKQKINFYDLINDVFEDLQFASNIREMHKIVDIRSVKDFYSDIYRLRIIFNNLISNALRYKKEYEDVKITIAITANEKQAEISFKDEGIGIAEEHQEKIFNMFYRASERNVGSGLGLYIVKETINKLNGKIAVKSALDAGTEFIIKIPNLG